MLKRYISDWELHGDFGIVAALPVDADDKAAGAIGKKDATVACMEVKRVSSLALAGQTR
jgi:hypothetical protein